MASLSVTSRASAAPHVVPVLVLGLLALWFGVVDTPGFGERRCSSCGVEGYVIAVHAGAAAVLACVVAAASRHPRTRLVLVIAGVYLAASLVWHPLFSVYALVTFFAAPLVAVWLVAWWIEDTSLLVRDRTTMAALARNTATRAWVALLVVLPGHFAWVWVSRVQWLVF